jgi:hypothetical protein
MRKHMPKQLKLICSRAFGADSSREAWAKAKNGSSRPHRHGLAEATLAWRPSGRRRVELTEAERVCYYRHESGDPLLHGWYDGFTLPSWAAGRAFQNQKRQLTDPLSRWLTTQRGHFLLKQHEAALQQTRSSQLSPDDWALLTLDSVIGLGAMTSDQGRRSPQPRTDNTLRCRY